MDKPASLGFIGSVIILVLAIFIAGLFPLLHDMEPADTAVQTAENIESIIWISGGVVIAGLGFAGSLLQRRGRKLSSVLLCISAILSFGFTAFVVIATSSWLLCCIVLVPAVLLSAACILSFKTANPAEGNNRFF